MKLAAVGSNCIDYYNNINGGTGYPGGGPVNMAVYTVRLGGKASYIGPVGNDEYGELMRNGIKSKGVDISHLYTKEGKTAVSQVTLTDGERIFGDYDEGVMADYRLSDDDIDFICTHDMVICDLWGKVEGQYKEIKARGMTTAFDCATRPDDPESQTAIPYTDYLFYSIDDGNTDDVCKKMKEYHSKGPKLVVCMMGIEGSLCYDGTRFYKCGIVQCDNVVDTMGAGDSYIAGFLFGISEGLSIQECMHLGAKTASETICYFGGW